MKLKPVRDDLTSNHQPLKIEGVEEKSLKKSLAFFKMWKAS